MPRKALSELVDILGWTKARDGRHINAGKRFLSSGSIMKWIYLMRCKYEYNEFYAIELGSDLGQLYRETDKDSKGTIRKLYGASETFSQFFNMGVARIFHELSTMEQNEVLSLVRFDKSVSACTFGDRVQFPLLKNEMLEHLLEMALAEGKSHDSDDSYFLNGLRTGLGGSIGNLPAFAQEMIFQYISRNGPDTYDFVYPLGKAFHRLSHRLRDKILECGLQNITFGSPFVSAVLYSFEYLDEEDKTKLNEWRRVVYTNYRISKNR